MRVESCGPLFAEPKEGDIFFPGHRLSEPIAIINPKNNLLGENEGRFLKFDGVEIADSSIADQSGLPFEPIEQQHPLPIGFFLTEEEWSLFKQPHLGLEPYEQSKMNNILSVSKSLTPLTSAPVTDAGQGSVGNVQAPDAQWSTNFETLSDASYISSVQNDEPNNNNVIDHISTLQHQSDFHKQATAVVQMGQNYGWHSSQDADSLPQQLSTTVNDAERNRVELDRSIVGLVDPTGYYQETLPHEELSNPNFDLPLPFDVQSISVSLGGLGSFLRTVPPVDTIASHPQPITSTSYDHNHTHHQHYPPLPLLPLNYEDLDQNTQGYFEDWQSQSTFLSTEVDKAKLMWNLSLNELNDQTQQSFLPQKTNFDKPRPPQSDEVEFVNFLSKFNNEVAAIWGGANYDGTAHTATLPYSEGYLSTCSTPISGNMYPWASPSADQNCGNYYYGLRAMDSHQEQQRRLAQAQCQRVENKFYGNQDKNYQKEPVHFKPSVANQEGDSCTIEPFEEECAIMQSLKQHFGVAPAKEEYFILKKMGVDSSADEKEKSLTELNHDNESSSFQRFVPALPCKAPAFVLSTAVSNPNLISSDMEIKAMQETFGGLGLDSDEDTGMNLEIATILKENPKTYIEQPLHVDLFRSWKTHFTPIEVLEKTNGYGLSTPPNLFSQDINPQLPEYRLFTGNDKEYNVYFRTEKSSFPIHFKLRRLENEKSVQTENPSSVSISSKNEAIMRQEQDLFTPRPVRNSDFDWENFCTGSDYNFNLSSSGTRTPMTESRSFFDYDNSLETQSSDWFSDGPIWGGGPLADFEYGSLATDNGNIMGLNHHPPFNQSSDYCCDSGIGIDGSSRAGFYDDAYTDYDGEEYDFTAGAGEGGVTYAAYGATTTDTDVDYGQFQGFAYNTWSTSTASGKTSKSHRRRTKMKPCKYFLLDGSCKRGQNCKFSHDLTTCRYWAEGSCLKGDACPYLHCFVERNSFRELENYRYGGNRYHLESKDDFPALGSSTNETTLLLSSHEQVSVEFPQQYTEGIVNAGSSAECLPMLADPAGSVYDSYTFGLHPISGGFTLPVPVRSVKGNSNKKQQDPATGAKRYGNKTAGKSHADNNGPNLWSRQGNNNANTNNNNWISSMISVKQTRRKKKPIRLDGNILQLGNEKS